MVLKLSGKTSKCSIQISKLIMLSYTAFRMPFVSFRMFLTELTIEIWQNLRKKHDFEIVLSPTETVNSGCEG